MEKTERALRLVPFEPEPVDHTDISLLIDKLDVLRARMASGDVSASMGELIDLLKAVRAHAARDYWRDTLAPMIVGHPISEIVLRCPITRHSRMRPRGYPGDAALLDHIYGTGGAAVGPHPATTEGQLYFFGVFSHACRAVRYRREILAREIDATIAAQAGRRANILSVACGHLREVEISRRLPSVPSPRFIAMDQDGESLAEASKCYAGLGVETVRESVRNILTRKVSFADLDLIYVAGLFDYLIEPVAMRLIEKLFGFLRPGGRLLIANFTPAVRDVGYMETFMDWWLIYRDRDQLADLLRRLPRNDIAADHLFEDDLGAIAYATVQKA